MIANSQSRKFVSRWIFGWIPFILISVIIFRGAILPPRKIPFDLIRLDKVLHAGEYFILFLVSVNAFKKAAQAWLVRHNEALALGYCLLLGGICEIAQLFVPGRVSDIYDWFFDGFGAGIAWAILFLLAFFLRKFFPGKISDELL